RLPFENDKIRHEEPQSDRDERDAADDELEVAVEKPRRRQTGDDEHAEVRFENPAGPNSTQQGENAKTEREGVDQQRRNERIAGALRDKPGGERRRGERSWREIRLSRFPAAVRGEQQRRQDPRDLNAGGQRIGQMTWGEVHGGLPGMRAPAVAEGEKDCQRENSNPTHGNERMRTRRAPIAETDGADEIDDGPVA